MEPICAAALNSAADEFCLGRMVTKIGLVRIGAMADLRAAKARIAALTKSWPGEYVVFRRNTGRVVAKASSVVSRYSTQVNKSNSRPANKVTERILEMPKDAQIKRHVLGEAFLTLPPRVQTIVGTAQWQEEFTAFLERMRNVTPIPMGLERANAMRHPRPKDSNDGFYLPWASGNGTEARP